MIERWLSTAVPSSLLLRTHLVSSRGHAATTRSLSHSSRRSQLIPRSWVLIELPSDTELPRPSRPTHRRLPRAQHSNDNIDYDGDGTLLSLRGANRPIIVVVTKGSAVTETSLVLGHRLRSARDTHRGGARWEPQLGSPGQVLATKLSCNGMERTDGFRPQSPSQQRSLS